MALARTKAVAELLPEAAPRFRLPQRATELTVLPLARLAEGAAPLRRCVFRKLTVASSASRGSSTSYGAECLYDGLDQAIPMGDLERAYSTCQACTYTGIFRADED
ncbi:MAG: hypothetical protein LH624_15405 [Cryobacterium sp.]|nr:hypothetical protein [Cryobacterium sp.]